MVVVVVPMVARFQEVEKQTLPQRRCAAKVCAPHLHPERGFGGQEALCHIRLPHLLLRQMQKACFPGSRQESTSFKTCRAARKKTPEIRVVHAVHTAWQSTDTPSSEAEMAQESPTLGAEF